MASDLNPLPAGRGSGPVTRSSDWVDREYNQEKWPAIGRMVEDRLEAEPDAGLSRTLRSVAAAQWRASDPVAGQEVVVAGALTQLPYSGAFGAEQGFLLDVLASHVTEDTDLVVELGSGWSWHLLSFWLDRGPRPGRYVGAEYTEAGRAVGARLAGLDDRLDYSAVAFDYLQPALDIAPTDGHALVFSNHSIEQIPEVPPALCEAVSGLGKRVTCVHFEPVGFQQHDGALIGSSREYADHHDYNRNLIPMLTGEADAGRIELVGVAPEVIGVNRDNATTVVTWRSTGA